MRTDKNKDKFKNEEELLKAYNELQAEFTKRCQRLAELENRSEESRDEGGEELTIPTEDKPQVEDDGDKEDDVSVVLLCEQIKEDADDRTKESLDDVLEQKETKSLCVEQPNNFGSTDMDYNGVSPQSIDTDALIRERLADPVFIDEVIMTDNNITSRIIAAYLGSLSGAGSVATLKSSAGSMFFSPIKRPKSLAEARAMAEKLLK